MEITERPPTPSDHPAATPAAIASAHAKVLRPTPELAEAMERGYEPKDISLRGIFIFLGSLVVTLVVVLFFIYGIMMALLDHDRSHDPLGTAMAVTRPEVYAPLQPSIGHPTEDWQDMIDMRQQTQAILNGSGTTATGRRYMPIADAMTKLIDEKKLVVTATPPPAYVHPYVYPPGSREGKYEGGVRERAESAETLESVHPKQ